MNASAAIVIRCYDGPVAGGLAPRTVTELYEHASGLWWEDNVALASRQVQLAGISENGYGPCTTRCRMVPDTFHPI